jgi:predicted permease
MLENFMLSLLHDLAFSLRQLRRHRTYATVAILSMALGIGAAAAVYSVLYGVLIDPYPYREANRIAFIVVHWEKDNSGGDRWFTLHQAADLRNFKSVEDSFAQGDTNMIATDGDLPVSVKVLQMTGNGLDFLGAPPMLGRFFTTAEAPAGNEPPPVAVISYLFWRTHFDSRADVVGKNIELDHKKYTVIGVAGPRFTWHDSEVYLPMPADADPVNRLQTLIRLRPGVSTAQAAGELSSFVDQDNHDHPNMFGPGKYRTEVQTLNDWLLGRFKGTLLLLFCAVGLLLVIGCGNVSILMLARGQVRQQELAMRSALGASRTRILRQLLTEAVLLSLVGGALGVGLAFYGIRLITGLLPEYSIPHEVVIAVNLPVLAFSTAVSVLCGILFGVSPAWRLSRPQLGQLVQSAAGRSVTMRRAPAQTALLIGQVGLTVLLLAAGAAAMRHYFEAYTAALGFDPHDVLRMELQLPQGAYATWEERATYYDQLTEKIQTVPGVTSAAFASDTPPWRGWRAQVDIVGQKPDPGRTTAMDLISPEYFSTLHIPLVAGRFFTRQEALRGAPYAIVSQTFVNRYFDGNNPIGRMITSTDFNQTWPGLVKAPTLNQPLQIIGVVADIRNDGLHRPIIPQVYAPYTLLLYSGQGLFVRGSGSTALLSHSVAASLLSVNPNQGVSHLMPFDAFLSMFAWSHERFTSVIFLLFSVIALGLSMVGLFSVISFGVEQRTREIGIRVALGARQWNVLALALSTSLQATLAGLAIGILASVLLSGTIYHWTDSKTSNAAVLSVVSVVFLLTALVACLWPVNRALRVDPLEALRSE